MNKEKQSYRNKSDVIFIKNTFVVIGFSHNGLFPDLFGNLCTKKFGTNNIEEFKRVKSLLKNLLQCRFRSFT